MRFVASFASSPTLTHFCRAEFIAVARFLGVDVAAVVSSGNGAPHWTVNSENDDSDDPFYVFESSACLEAIQAVADRCVLLRAVHVLLQAAPSLEALYVWRSAAVREWSAHQAQSCPFSAAAPPSLPLQHAASAVIVGEEEGEFAVDDYAYGVETVGKRYSEADKRAILNAVVSGNRALAERRVNWQTPKRRFLVLIQHATEAAPRGAAKGWEPNGPILRVLHVACLTAGGRAALLGKYDLRKRPYIGTTSMPPEESILMVNFAAVQQGSYVLDPFCGTGSLLVAASHCGGRTLGTDADGRAMRGGTRKGAASPQLQQQRQLALGAYSEADLASLTPEERVLPTMRTNFKVYGLPAPDCVRMNFSTWQFSWRRGGGGVFDAVVTDPPYGIREPRRKALSKDTTEGSPTAPPTNESRHRHELTEYNTNEVVLDLVLFAAEHLRIGGRLTFWHPTTDKYTDSELPAHPSLRVLWNLPQRLSLKFVRRLVTMEKIAEVPYPPPPRASCAPQKLTDNMRALMHQTALPENAEYTSYRARLQRRRDAARQFQEGNRDSGSAREAQKSVRAKEKRSRTQEQVVANRQKNLRIREEKQHASHLANLRRQQEHERAESDQK